MIDRGLATFEGVLSLLPTEDGGLRGPLPSPTRSLVLIFAEGKEPVAPWTIGAQITVLGSGELRPGIEDVPVRIEFWAANEGEALVADNQAFSVWIGRIVGSGKVTREISG